MPLVSFVCAFLILANASVYGATLGQARPFNVVSFGGYSSNSDVNGRVAVRGKLGKQLTIASREISSNFDALGSQYQSVFTTVLNSGINGQRVQQNVGGNVYAPGYQSSTNLIKIQNGPGSVVTSGPSPIDWDYLQADLTAESIYLRTLPGYTPTVTGTDVVVNTTGRTDNVMANVQLFRITMAQFQKLRNIETNGKTVIIDVDLTGLAEGGTVRTGNTNYTINGQQWAAGSGFQNRVLFNFCGGTSGTACSTNTLDIRVGFYGTILAPNTTLTGNQQINGQFIVGNVNYNGQIHGTPFVGMLPDRPQADPAVPEPSTIALVGGAAAVAVVLKKRARRTAAGDHN